MQSDTSPQPITAQSPSDLISVELSARRTGMSFQRTRMSADRTLMSVIRTSLSLISFGEITILGKALRAKAGGDRQDDDKSDEQVDGPRGAHAVLPRNYCAA